MKYSWVVIDEIDKVGSRGHHGDPSAAFLEVLDPEQNNTFVSSFSKAFCFASVIFLKERGLIYPTRAFVLLDRPLLECAI